MPKSGDSNDKPSFLNDELSRRTSILGLRLWVVLGICVGAGIVIVIILLTLWFTTKRNQNRTLKTKTHNTQTITHEIPTTTKLQPFPPSKSPLSVFSREVTEIRFDDVEADSKPGRETRPNRLEGSDQALTVQSLSPVASDKRIHIEIGNDNRIAYPERGNCSSSQGSGGGNRSGDQTGYGLSPDVSHLGWGQWYSLRELEEATNGFDDENVIGEGGYGIVYRGVTEIGTVIAVKNLMNNRGQAEKEFKVEVEAIGRVRHKNLVRLIGYCAEGAHRILIYEYVDNGNLEQWLHGEVGPHSPLTWESRMNIITGTAKGLTYLHEGLEPKVVHRDIKSSNILLDKQWNPKVSDFGLAKLLGSERNYVTTRVMGTFGYVAPEYASTGMLNERSDVYSFGILLMEIISGRNPVDYSRPPGEVNLVDWIKMMVSKRNTEGVLDPKLAEKPSSRALKRALLVALRCVDPNAQKRPKIGNVVHMLETEEFPSRDDRRVTHGHGRLRSDPTKERLMETMSVASLDSGSGYESGAPYPAHRLPWINQQEPEERTSQLAS